MREQIATTFIDAFSFDTLGQYAKKLSPPLKQLFFKVHDDFQGQKSIANWHSNFSNPLQDS